MKETIEKKLYIDYLVFTQLGKDNVNLNSDCINQDKIMMTGGDGSNSQQNNDGTEEY